MASHSCLTALRATCLAAAIAALSVGSAVAQPTGAIAPRGNSIVHLANGTTFNWLAKKQRAAKPAFEDAVLLSSANAAPVNLQRFLGHGSYICSPSGFGHRSTCFAR